MEILLKIQCGPCGKPFIIDDADVEAPDVYCPFCGGLVAIPEDDDDEDHEDDDDEDDDDDDEGGRDV